MVTVRDNWARTKPVEAKTRYDGMYYCFVDEYLIDDATTLVECWKQAKHFRRISLDHWHGFTVKAWRHDSALPLILFWIP